MDLLEQPYRSQMRLFYDSPSTLVEGAWHLCPPGALVFPDWHAFGSQRQDPDELKWDDPPVGEVRGRQGAVSGVPTPGITGQHFCGTISAWQNGDPLSAQGSQPVDSRGRPVCCQAVDPGMLRLNASGFGTPVRQWFLRSDQVPVPPVLPAEMLLGWTIGGPPSDQLTLDGAAGSTPDSRDASATYLPFGLARSIGAIQFISPPLSHQDLPAQIVTVSIGWEILAAFHVHLSPLMGVALVNGTDGTLKQDLTGAIPVGGSQTTVTPLRGRLFSFLTVPIAIATGDYLVVELGLGVADDHLLGHTYHVQFSWEGADLITVNGQVITSAKAVLTLEDA